MQEEFVKALFMSIVLENVQIYQNLFDTTKIDSKTTEHWKNALKMYNGLSANQKDIFISVIRQTIIDTISNFFGIIDGGSTLNGFDLDVKFEIDNKEVNGKLQDQFLELIENIEN
ncbi:MAG: hypothetical protein JEZ00_22220 [Anaerolineaceae bacterium]|nr:hypothetical protein [Anaerolineaceae bacterium]